MCHRLLQRPLASDILIGVDGLDVADNLDVLILIQHLNSPLAGERVGRRTVNEEVYKTVHALLLLGLTNHHAFFHFQPTAHVVGIGMVTPDHHFK